MGRQKGKAENVEPADSEREQEENRETVDFSDIRGQEAAKRAAEIAAAGGHNLILVGAPGAGKSMIAKALSGILPSMTWEECREVSSDLQRLRENHRGSAAGLGTSISGTASYGPGDSFDRRRHAAEARGLFPGNSWDSVF